MQIIRKALAETLRTGEEAHATFYEDAGATFFSGLYLMGSSGRNQGATVLPGKGLLDIKTPKHFNFNFHIHPVEVPSEYEVFMLSDSDLMEGRGTILGMAAVPIYRTKRFVNIGFLFAKIPETFDMHAYAVEAFNLSEGEKKPLGILQQHSVLRKLGVKLLAFSLPFKKNLGDFGFIEGLKARIVSELR